MTDVSTSRTDPKSTASYRILKAVVIGLGVLIAVAMGLVVLGIVMRVSGHAPAQSSANRRYDLPAGSKIESTQVAGDSLVVTVKTPSGDSVYIFSATDGHLVGVIAPKAK